MKRKKLHAIQLLIVFAVLVVVSGCGSSPPAVNVEPQQAESAPMAEEVSADMSEPAFDEQLAGDLQSALEAAVASPDTNWPGAVLHVSSPELGTWTGAAGLGDPETNTVMRPNDKFRGGSITKPFVSVVILQMVEEGLLLLDDTLTTVLPESVTSKLINRDKITVRMLLNHSAGLPDFMDTAGPEIIANLDKVWTADEFLDFAAMQESWFAPGEAQAYSNTDYLLLGMVIDEVGGDSWQNEMRARIFEPLGLQNTVLPEPDDATIPGEFAHGYSDMGGGPVDMSEIATASVVGAAGGASMVTNAEDMARFVSAVAASELFQESETLAEMVTPLGMTLDTPLGNTVPGYSLGLMHADFGGGIKGIGHSGDTPGYNTFVFHFPAQNMTISGAVNADDYQAGFVQLIPRALDVLVPGYAIAEQPSAQEPDAATKIQVPDYQKIIDEVLQDDRPAIALHVTTPAFEVFETRGYADWENEIPLEKDHLFRIASVTKPFIATLASMLHAEGKLDLDETITSYLPESMTSHIQYADQITIRQLLNHTSGVFDTGDNPAWWTEQFENPTKEWTDAEAVEFAYDQPAYFEPGTGFAYSNTNYQLVGLILDEVVGRHHSEELRSRILDPLGLSSTFYEQHEEFDRDRLTHGYFDFDGDGIAEDYYDLRIDTGHADGGLISTVEDMEIFITALFKNDDFPDAGTKEQFLQELMTIVPVASQDPAELGSGPGIAEYDYGYGKGYGHIGGTPGYVANMIYFPDHDVTLTLTWNGFDGGFESMGVVPIMFESLIEATFSALGHEKAADENDASAGNVYEDPQGRFSMPLVGGWTPVEGTDAFAHFTQAEPAMNMYIIAVESTDVDAGIGAALTEVDIDSSALTLLDASGFGQWTLLFYEQAAERGVAVLAQVRDDTTYSLIFTGNSDVTRRPPSTVMETIEGFTFAGEGDEAVLPATVEEFESYANNIVETLPPGLSIVIAANGAIAYANGFGMADGPLEMAATADTVYPWASMTKIATATAIMQLYEQGQLDLDAPVADYLDYFPAEYPITVRQLLDHTAGLSDPLELVLQKFNLDGEPKPDPDEAARTYYEQFAGPMFAPGSELAYANMNFLTLGEIVAAVSGQSYIDYVREHILVPLGMTQTDFTYSEAMIANAAAGAIPATQTENMVTALDQARGLDDGADFIRETGEEFTWMNRYNIFAPWGGLIGPATDVMRFAQMHLNGGELDGVRILSSESVTLMQEMQLSTAGDPLGHGLGWEIVDDAEQLTIQHSGSGAGVQALMRLYPNEGVAVVLMSNAVGYAEEDVVDAAANVVFSLLGGGGE